MHEKPKTLEELRNKVTQFSNDISPATLANVRGEFYNRLGNCEAQEGGLFEQLIK